MLFDYWCGLHEHLRTNNSFLSGIKPLPQVWNEFLLGKTGCYLQGYINRSDKHISVHLVLTGKRANERYSILEPQRKHIEHEAGTKLIWQAPEDKKQRYVILRKQDVDPTERSDWSSQFTWLQTHLELFYKLFQQRVKMLDESIEDEEE